MDDRKPVRNRLIGTIHDRAARIRPALHERHDASDFDLRTQDTLIIVNQDDETFAVGGLTVRADQTMTYHFARPGRYGGACELHPGSNVDIVVH